MNLTLWVPTLFCKALDERRSNYLHFLESGDDAARFSRLGRWHFKWKHPRPSIFPPPSVAGRLAKKYQEREGQDRAAQPVNQASLIHSLVLLRSSPITQRKESRQSRVFVLLQTFLQLQIIFFHLSFPPQAVSGVHFNLILPAWMRRRDPV